MKLEPPTNDQGTEFRNSIDLSSRRWSHTVTVNKTCTNHKYKTRIETPQAEFRFQDKQSQTILKSFSQNNVRENLKGANVHQLIYGIDFGGSQNSQTGKGKMTTFDSTSPLRDHKYVVGQD